jgi:hypothetical protein
LCLATLAFPQRGFLGHGRHSVALITSNKAFSSVQSYTGALLYGKISDKRLTHPFLPPTLQGDTLIPDAYRDTEALDAHYRCQMVASLEGELDVDLPRGTASIPPPGPHYEGFSAPDGAKVGRIFKLRSLT